MMESLSDETWDVVIAGTSLPQSLLALSFSRSDLKILHVDRNDYYGGRDAGLSLDEAEEWATSRKDVGAKCTRTDNSNTLKSSRAYTISLNPQVLYSKSRVLPKLVSSQIHTQLEFLAVGSFWVQESGRLRKIPNNREDIFTDDKISMRDKRRLAGLLRQVLEQETDTAETLSDQTLAQMLERQYKISPELFPAIQALTLTTGAAAEADANTALKQLKIHLTSMGYFGPGLAAVTAKYGGNSEITQVACRAAAVGGATYLLGHGIESLNDDGQKDEISVTLSDGTTVSARYVVGLGSDLPASFSTAQLGTNRKVLAQTSIVSDPLKHLFTSTTENGTIPAVAIILVPGQSADEAPVFLQIHSEDTGECPAGQCIIHASMESATNDEQDRLSQAVDAVLSGTKDAGILWTLFRNGPLAHSSSRQTSLGKSHGGKVLMLPDEKHSVTLRDDILTAVEEAWQLILGEERTSTLEFLRLAARSDEEVEDE